MRRPDLVSILACISMLGLGACREGTAPSNTTDAPTGSVKLPLQTTAPSGTVYQLRDAVFDIAGPTTTTLSTAGSPDSAAVLSAPLLVGSYTITLRAGWTLVRINAAGAQAVAATLTSANPLAFAVAGGGTTNVGFVFLASGDPVDFSTGTVNVGVTVNEDGGVPTTPQSLTVQLMVGGTNPTGSGTGSAKPGSVTSSPAGIDCRSQSTGADGPSCQANFPGGSNVTLTAVGTSVVVFAHWSGACTGTNPTITVPMTAARDCTAIFAPPPDPAGSVKQGMIGISISPGGVVTSNPAGVSCGSGGTSCNVGFPYNTVVALTATPNAGFMFSGWTGDCSGTSPTTFVISVERREPQPDISCGANFAAISPPDGGTTPDAGGNPPDAGGPSSQQLTVQLMVGGTNPTGSGTGSAKPGSVTSSPAGIDCRSQSTGADGPSCQANFPGGSNVTLTAIGTSVVVFAHWSGACTGTNPTITVPMTAARDCTAIFAPPPDPAGSVKQGMIGISISPGGSVTSNPAGVSCGSGGTNCNVGFPYNTVVALTATPNAGFMFSGWTGDCSGTSPTTFVISVERREPQPDISCGANFSAMPAPAQPPTFVGAGAGVAGTGDLTVPFPAGVAPGQLLVLQLGSRSSNVPVTPAGWTAMLADEHGNVRQRLFIRRAAAGEPASVTVAFGASNVNAARMYAFSGVGASSNATIAGGRSTDDDGTLPGPTLTAPPSTLAVAFVALDFNVPMAEFMNETGGNWTEAVAEFPSDVGNNFALQLQIAPMPTGGTIAGGEANFGGGTDSSLCNTLGLVAGA